MLTLASLGSYQLSFTESKFTFFSSFDGFDHADDCTASGFLFTGDPPFQKNTDSTAVVFKVLLRPASDVT